MYEIEARDHGQTPLSSRTTIYIKIVHVNEFTPVFDTSAQTIVLDENEPLNQNIGKVNTPKGFANNLKGKTSLDKIFVEENFVT